MVKPAYRLVRLANGTHSVHSIEHGETFHPVIGPVAEAEALYVRQLGLVERVQMHREEFVIWDVGLGAAANAVTVLRALAGIPKRIRILSFDHTLEPLKFALDHTDPLSFLVGYEQPLRELIGRSLVEFDQSSQHVSWELHLGDFPALLDATAAHRLQAPHAILFDAFSPRTNPAMWTEPLFSRIYQLLDPNRPCALPTYSRSTLLRVTLLLAGFFVGAGHATGEKDETTIAANTLELIAEPLPKKWLDRVRRSNSAEPLWEPVYRQAPLSSATWEKLRHHPQFV